MAEVQENSKRIEDTVVETAPQFVLWVPEEGLFKPARLVHSKNYIGHDISRNAEYVPNAEGLHLQLVGSPYMGPVNFVDEDYNATIIKKSFESMMWSTMGRLQRIVESAESVAKDQKIPYFSVMVFETIEREPEEETSENQYESIKLLEKKISLHFERLKGTDAKAVTRILHPTVQLYVPQD